MTLQLDCNRCNCRNGVLFCTRRTCEDDNDGDDDDSDSDNDDSDSDDDSDGDEPEEERNCHACGFMPENPVCGEDGQTYPSMCHAMNCRGLDADDIIPGSCSNQVQQL